MQSLLAAERSSWLVGVLVGWVVLRLVVCWPVVGSVVVAVDIGTCDLLEGWTEGPAAHAGGGTGLENPLAGDGFRAIESPISHRGDRGAAHRHEPESRAENPGRMGGLLSGRGTGPRGVPHR